MGEGTKPLKRPDALLIGGPGHGWIRPYAPQIAVFYPPEPIYELVESNLGVGKIERPRIAYYSPYEMSWTYLVFHCDDDPCLAETDREPKWWEDEYSPCNTIFT